MTVTVLDPDCADQLSRHIARLNENDVLVMSPWRITVASDPTRPFWLEGRGQVFQIQRTRKSAAALRTLMRKLDAAAVVRNVVK